MNYVFEDNIMAFEDLEVGDVFVIGDDEEHECPFIKINEKEAFKMQFSCMVNLGSVIPVVKLHHKLVILRG